MACHVPNLKTLMLRPPRNFSKAETFALPFLPNCINCIQNGVSWVKNEVKAMPDGAFAIPNMIKAMPYGSFAMENMIKGMPDRVFSGQFKTNDFYLSKSFISNL